MKYKVSVIICTLNCEDTIEDVIRSAVEAKPYELIVVDGHSSDGTLDIAKKYTDRIVFDPGKGLAVARKMGLMQSTGDYIFYLGSDNIILPDALTSTVDYMKAKTLVGCAIPTRIKECPTYTVKGLDFRWKSRFYESIRDVIGTPSCWEKKILDKYEFDDEMSWSDDTDIGERLKQDGYKLGYSDSLCYEVGYIDNKEIFARFKMYGLSDFQFYSKYKSEWQLRRKLRSLFHPIYAELFDPLKRATIRETFYFLPFLIKASYFRVKGFRLAKKRNKKGVI